MLSCICVCGLVGYFNLWFVVFAILIVCGLSLVCCFALCFAVMVLGCLILAFGTAGCFCLTVCWFW